MNPTAVAFGGVHPVGRRMSRPLTMFVVAAAVQMVAVAAAVMTGRGAVWGAGRD